MSICRILINMHVQKSRCKNAAEVYCASMCILAYSFVSAHNSLKLWTKNKVNQSVIVIICRFLYSNFILGIAHKRNCCVRWHTTWQNNQMECWQETGLVWIYIFLATFILFIIIVVDLVVKFAQLISPES